MPNPWDPTQTMGGSASLSIAYMYDAFGPDWINQHPDAPNITWNGIYDQFVQFMTDNLYWSYDYDEELWESNPDWLYYALYAPIDKCPDEYCKALGRTGNADVTGIGVRSVIRYGFEEYILTDILLGPSLLLC